MPVREIKGRWHFKARYCDFYCYTRRLTERKARKQFGKCHIFINVSGWDFRFSVESLRGRHISKFIIILLFIKWFRILGVNADCSHQAPLLLVPKEKARKRIGIYKYFAFTPAWSERNRDEWESEKENSKNKSTENSFKKLSISLAFGICVESKIFN